MKVEGTRSFSAPRAIVWQVLNDPARMAKTMPGVESFEIEDERRWSAKVKIPLGFGGLQMSINFDKTDERELEYAQLRAKGTGVGALMQMTTEFNLSDEGAGTSMRWEADVRIAGPVGSMGQRVLQPIVNQQVGNVLAALDEQVREAASASGSELQGAGPPADPGPEGEAGAREGSSGAEEGLNPWHEEAYSDEPQGPTTSTEDPRT